MHMEKMQINDTSDPILARRARPMRVLVFLFAVLFSIASPARADVTVSPLRQVFDENTREARFVISNPTTRIIDGRATWLDLSATPTGYTDAPPEVRQRLSAAPWFTLEPAQFRLAPGERVEIVIRRKNNARPPAGERRSHLFIETAAARTLMRKASDRGLQVDIGAGISTPVLLRGSGAAKAEIGETRLLRDSEGLLLLSTKVENGGGHSTYGRLIATFQPRDYNGPKEVLVVRENISAFPDAKERLVELPLGYFSLGAGELTIRYEGAAEYEGVVFDQRRFDISPTD